MTGSGVVASDAATDLRQAMKWTKLMVQKDYKMSSHAIVYASRSRQTGALCLTIDTKHSDVKDGKLPFKGPMVDNKFEGFGPVVEMRKRTKDEGTRRYAAVCLDHKQTAYFDDHYPAGRAIAWPAEWCTKCAALLAAGNKVKVPAKATATVVEAKAPVKGKAKAKPKAARKPRAARVPVAAGNHEMEDDGDAESGPHIIDLGDEPDGEEDEG